MLKLKDLIKENLSINLGERRKGVGNGVIHLGDLLLESPDYVAALNLKINREAKAFGWIDGKMYLSDYDQSHAFLGDEYDELANRAKKRYEGRIWEKSKVISFWTYPPKNIFKRVITDLEKATKKKIWKKKWRLEIADFNEKKYNDPDAGEDYFDYSLLPVEDYIKSVAPKRIQHNISPTMKTKRVVPKGLGSRKKVRGAKKGETPAAAHFRLRKGLGDGVIRLKDLIREIFILYEDQSDELVKIARSQNGLISPKGEAYAVPAIRHIDFLVKQPKFKSFKKRLAQASGNEYAVIYEAIMNEAMSDGWVRISGNKKELGFMATKKTLAKQKRLIDDIVIFVESVVKRPVKVYRTEFMIRKPQKNELQ